MDVLRNVILQFTAATTLSHAQGPQVPPSVPREDQIAIYSAVLRAERARLPELLKRLPLLLVITPPPRDMSPNLSRVVDSTGEAPDSSVAGPLLRAGVVSGLCRSLAADRCAGPQRGMGARLGPIRLLDSTHALVVVSLLVMQARHDNALLVRNEDRGGVRLLERVAGRWELSVPPGRLPP